MSTYLFVIYLWLKQYQNWYNFPTWKCKCYFNGTYHTLAWLSDSRFPSCTWGSCWTRPCGTQGCRQPPRTGSRPPSRRWWGSDHSESRELDTNLTNNHYCHCTFFLLSVFTNMFYLQPPWWQRLWIWDTSYFPSTSWPVLLTWSGILIYLFVCFVSCLCGLWTETAALQSLLSSTMSWSPRPPPAVTRDRSPNWYCVRLGGTVHSTTQDSPSWARERGKQVYITWTACLYFKRSTHGYETETFLPHVSGRLGRRKMRSSDGLCYESIWTKSGPYKLGLASKQYLWLCSV